MKYTITHFIEAAEKKINGLHNSTVFREVLDKESIKVG